jgi:hypothetical protein
MRSWISLEFHPAIGRRDQPVRRHVLQPVANMRGDGLGGFDLGIGQVDDAGDDLLVGERAEDAEIELGLGGAKLTVPVAAITLSTRQPSNQLLRPREFGRMPNDRAPSVLEDRNRLPDLSHRLLGRQRIDHGDVGWIADDEPVIFEIEELRRPLGQHRKAIAQACRMSRREPGSLVPSMTMRPPSIVSSPLRVRRNVDLPPPGRGAIGGGDGPRHRDDHWERLCRRVHRQLLRPRAAPSGSTAHAARAADLGLRPSGIATCSTFVS